MKRSNPKKMVDFVCEHGAAKSILAATYFDHIAREMGLAYRAIARGTNPDPEVSPQVLSGLAGDGLTPIERTPQTLTETEVQSAKRVVSFCELPVEYRHSSIVEYWQDVPPASENYGKSRDVIVALIRQLLKSLE